MPKKPKLSKQTITIVVGGNTISATLTPPTGSRRSWYVYWNGLVTSKSTGQQELQEAVRVVESMLRNGGQKSTHADTVLSDDEFEEIQRRHYAKKTGPFEQ